MKVFRQFIPNRAPEREMGLTNRGSEAKQVYPIRVLTQIIGGRTWSVSLIRLDPPITTDEWLDKCGHGTVRAGSAGYACTACLLPTTNPTKEGES